MAGMGHLRFRCTMPKPPPRSPAPYPTINAPLPSLADCTVVFVDDDGREHNVAGVTRFTFDSGAPGEHVAAHLELHGVEVDLACVPEASEPVLDLHGRVVGRTAPRGPVAPLIPGEAAEKAYAFIDRHPAVGADPVPAKLAGTLRDLDPIDPEIEARHTRVLGRKIYQPLRKTSLPCACDVVDLAGGHKEGCPHRAPS